MLSFARLMGADSTFTLSVIEALEPFLEKRRPPEQLRSELDLAYRIEGQSVILYEIRPHFMKPDVIIHSDFAKATYIRKDDLWKVYWMRASGKWELYKPKPQVGNLKVWVKLVDEDELGCFFG